MNRNSYEMNTSMYSVADGGLKTICAYAFVFSRDFSILS